MSHNVTTILSSESVIEHYSLATDQFFNSSLLADSTESYMFLECRPPPSRPASPVQSYEILPIMPIHLDIYSGLHSGDSSMRKCESRRQEDEDGTDNILDSLTITTDDGQHCEACGAHFASTRLQVFLRHVKLNICRRRQFLAGHGSLGRWWMDKK